MRISLSGVLLVSLALLAVQADGVSAQSASFRELTEPLRAGAAETYADLIQLVVPGIVVGDGRYSGVPEIDIRHIDGEEGGDLRPMPTGSLLVSDVALPSGGSDRLAVLFDFGDAEYSVEGFVILALFDIAEEVKLLDAAHVGFDRRTYFLDPARLPLGAGSDLLVTQSAHSNSGQHYEIAALILVRNDRFELVDIIFSFSERGCAFDRTQRLSVRHGEGEPFASVIATVTERTAAPEGACDEAVSLETAIRTITVTYRWDTVAQRYLPDSDAFVVLARENEERF